MTNLEIAALLRAVAAAYEIKEGNKPNTKFRVIAYERAADSIEHATSELYDLWQEGKLDEVPGIGQAIEEHLTELFKTGASSHFMEVLSGLPPAMFEFLNLPGIGAKTAYKLAKELKITKAKSALEKLAHHAQAGRIRAIPGFGEQSEKEIVQSIEGKKGKTRRFLMPYAAEIAKEILEWLKKEKSVKEAEALGSLRRRVATVGDIDVAVASDKPRETIVHFLAYPKKTRKIESGEHTASIMAPGNVQIDLMVQPPAAFGALLQHFTGSKNHNVALRTYAQKKGISLSEYGIKRGKKLYKIATEEEFYKKLGMDWIPPELREDQGELEAALRQAQGKPDGLPKLIELGDIKGDLHMHSNLLGETSHDVGADSPEDHLRRARTLGYQYIAFTEHNPRSTEKEGKILSMLKRKREHIKKLDGRGLKVFNSLEVDIRPDGSLALPEKAFDLLDYVIVGIHSSFSGTRAAQTKRVMKALAHPKVKIFAHPTARKLQEREEVDLDWEKIFDFCKRQGKILEINSFPDRLDLPDSLVHGAIKHGVKLAISTDSHAVAHMDLMEYGVSCARRGWAQKTDIVNTFSLNKFEKLVK